MYLNLLFKSIKADVGGASGDRVKALVRRFVQVLVAGGSGASEFVAGGLWLLGEVCSYFLLSVEYTLITLPSIAFQHHSWAEGDADETCQPRLRRGALRPPQTRPTVLPCVFVTPVGTHSVTAPLPPHDLPPRAPAPLLPAALRQRGPVRQHFVALFGPIRVQER